MGQARSMQAWANLPSRIDQNQQDIGKEKRLSVAWELRDSAQRCVSEQVSLLFASQGGTT